MLHLFARIVHAFHQFDFIHWSIPDDTPAPEMSPVMAAHPCPGMATIQHFGDLQHCGILCPGQKKDQKCSPISWRMAEHP